jgi:hypothetical protein
MLPGDIPERPMLQRKTSLAAACLLLSSCQPPTYDILAAVRGADLVFDARGSGRWPFRSDDGISAELVQVRDRGRILWAIQRDPDRPDCTPSGATPPFPLVYGRTPACYFELVGPVLPRPGVLHRIDGEGFRSGSGLFRLQGKAINVEWSDVEEEVGRWPALPDPRFPPGPGNGQPYLPSDPESARVGPINQH